MECKFAVFHFKRSEIRAKILNLLDYICCVGFLSQYATSLVHETKEEKLQQRHWHREIDEIRNCNKEHVTKINNGRWE